MAEEKKKVYMVTSGEYSDYHVCGIFSTLEKAEQYIAAHDTACVGDNSWDRHYIEVVEVDDCEIECKTMYRAIKFWLGEKNCSWEMNYSTKPFELCIEERLRWGGGYIGTIPVERTYTDGNGDDDSVVVKIVHDRVAQWKAEQAGL